MAVEIKYVVVRKGEEKMTFASKKEADAYDKMLDMAEVFSDWLGTAYLSMEEEQREALGLFLAENKDAVQHILRTSKMPEQGKPARVDEAHKAADRTQSEGEEQREDVAEPVADKSNKNRPAIRGARAA